MSSFTTLFLTDTWKSSWIQLKLSSVHLMHVAKMVNLQLDTSKMKFLWSQKVHNFLAWDHDSRCIKILLMEADTNNTRISASLHLTSTWSSVSGGCARAPSLDLMPKGSSFSGNTSLSTPSRVTMNFVFSLLKQIFYWGSHHHNSALGMLADLVESMDWFIKLPNSKASTKAAF